MGWWGKLAGGAFGFMFGGPLGAVLGAVLGHNLDRGLDGLSDQEELQPGAQERVQTAFFTATFSVLGHLAKVDGRVSKQEISMAEQVMRQMELEPEARRTAIRLFQQGKADDFPLDQVLQQFRQECHRRTTLLQMFMEILLQAAYIDGPMDPAEERLLLYVCRQLGIPEFLFRRLERMVQAELHDAGRQQATPQARDMALEDAYAILNLESAASDAEVKKAYRRLTSQHHPDKLVAKGLPEEMMKLAAQKTHEIRQAYERIRAARGL